MFTIINIINKDDDENNILQKLKYFSCKNKIYIEKTEEFFILNYNNYGKKIKWKKIIKRCPTVDVVLTRNTSVPKNFRLRVYNSNRYKRYLLKETISKILKCINLQPSQKNLLFIDKDGDYCNLVTEIAVDCAGIYVITDNIEKYTKVQRNLIKELGLSLSICTKIPNKNNVFLCIAFSDISCYNIRLMDIPTFVITQNEQVFKQLQPMSIKLMSPKSFYYDDILPLYIDEIDVCGAVREINGKSFNDYCEQFILKDNVIGFKDLISLIEETT